MANQTPSKINYDFSKAVKFVVSDLDELFS